MFIFKISSTDASPSPSLSLPEDEIERRLNDLERKLDDLERQLLSPSSGDSWDSQSEQGSFSDDCLSRSDSLEGWLCPPLPGQVPVEPTETSNGRTAQGATEASPANKSSTGEFDIRLASVKCTDRDFAISCVRLLVNVRSHVLLLTKVS